KFIKEPRRIEHGGRAYVHCYNASQAACKSLILGWFIDFFAQFETIGDEPPGIQAAPTPKASGQFFCLINTSAIDFQGMFITESGFHFSVAHPLSHHPS